MHADQLILICLRKKQTMYYIIIQKKKTNWPLWDYIYYVYCHVLCTINKLHKLYVQFTFPMEAHRKQREIYLVYNIQ